MLVAGFLLVVFVFIRLIGLGLNFGNRLRRGFGLGGGSRLGGRSGGLATLTLHFDGDQLAYGQEYNVSFSPRLPVLTGKME